MNTISIGFWFIGLMLALLTLVVAFFFTPGESKAIAAELTASLSAAGVAVAKGDPDPKVARANLSTRHDGFATK